MIKICFVCDDKEQSEQLIKCVEEFFEIEEVNVKRL